MSPNQLVTKEDINNLEIRLISMMENITTNSPIDLEQETYLRSKEIRKLLSISDNTLRAMREKGEIPYSFIGSIYYYPKIKILETLEINTIN
ncbi:helix-turn-helix domain-containing protein [Vicingus serpentipes]|uniref:Helix-turn-helix domain-containing protein n=1 Tax=Vicingus serpentipes TaxID=1926625 RepID=A0A5C6RVS8_9FLAO|nr:helix-turn-helix domain-containing protein [Vicingus serpentipes]TXB66144.1 helix-turn-helix domain-containing protein [Vicingus serpentipes]